MADGNSIVRVGIVSDIDVGKTRVRVYYPELSNMVSGWLPVLQRPFRGSAGAAPFHVNVTIEEAVVLEETHTHGAEVSYSDSGWMPRVNDPVLVLYTPGFNTDGYVLGVIP